MNKISTKTPEEMLADERLQEIANILASAILRENERSFTGLVPQKKRSKPCKTRRKMQ